MTRQLLAEIVDRSATDIQLILHFYLYTSCLLEKALFADHLMAAGII